MRLEITLVAKLPAAEGTLILLLIVVDVHEVLHTIMLVAQAFETDRTGKREIVNAVHVTLQSLRVTERFAALQAAPQPAGQCATGQMSRYAAVLQDRTNIPSMTQSSRCHYYMDNGY